MSKKVFYYFPVMGDTLKDASYWNTYEEFAVKDHRDTILDILEYVEDDLEDYLVDEDIIVLVVNSTEYHYKIGVTTIDVFNVEGLTDIQELIKHDDMYYNGFNF